MTTKFSRFARFIFFPDISYNDCAKHTIILGMFAAVMDGKGLNKKGLLDWMLIYNIYSGTFSKAASYLVEFIRFWTIFESTLLIILRNLKSYDAISPYYKYMNTLTRFAVKIYTVTLKYRQKLYKISWIYAKIQRNSFLLGIFILIFNLLIFIIFLLWEIESFLCWFLLVLKLDSSISQLKSWNIQPYNFGIS